MKIAMQMDPIQYVDINADTSFRIAEEAQTRGHELFVYQPNDLYFDRGRVLANIAPMQVQRDPQKPAILGEADIRDMTELDVIWIRQDPPFDMHYITNTHLLDRLSSDVLVLNRPSSVRNAPEKLMVLDFPEFIPPTMITADLERLKAFKEEFGDVIVKPLFGNGGAGIFRLMAEDRNLTSLFELFQSTSRDPLIIQQFLPAVAEGDKRILLIDGEAVGAINRVPPKGETRSNLHVGGRAEKTQLTQREQEICAALRPVLQEQGLLLVGIDVIGGYLTEINVTSPTGIQELERFDGINVAGLMWDKIEGQISKKFG